MPHRYPAEVRFQVIELARSGTKVAQLDRFDRWRDRAGVEAARAHRLDLAIERAQRHLVAAPAQLVEDRRQREEVPAGGRGVGEDAAQGRGGSVSGSSSSRIASSVCRRLSPLSRRRSFQV
jgi:hypothetical protein